MIHHRRFGKALGVCPECGHHHLVSAAQRVEQLLDPGSFRAFASPEVVLDPLGFVDAVPYPSRLAAAREATGLEEAAVGGLGTIDGRAVVLVVMDFRFLGGSLGVAVGELVTVAAETAAASRAPLVTVCASGGARMQEGVVALMQMAKTAGAFAALDEAGVLSVSVVTDPTFGGVAASFATLADVILIEPGARMGFAGPRVIQQTIRQELPRGFQTAEFLLAHGMVDAVVPRAGLRGALGRLVSLCGGGASSAGTLAGATADAGVSAGAGAAAGAGAGAAAGVGTAGDISPYVGYEPPEREPWDVVRLARETGRPTTADYAGLILDDFLRLHGDRTFGDSPSIVAGIGRLDGIPLMLIGHQKGHTTRDRVAANFGMPEPEGYRMAARLMRLADKLGLPVLTLVDTPGAYPGLTAEERGQALAIAESQRLMAQLRVPVVTVVTGEGGSGGALALAVANRVLISANAWYSVITPEGCASILWKSAAEAARAAAALKVEARELLNLGIVDAIVEEPPDGAHTDPAKAASLLGTAVRAALADLLPLPALDLIRQRRTRFRRFGLPIPVTPSPSERADRVVDVGTRQAGSTLFPADTHQEVTYDRDPHRP
ncbi:acetyl-CoA carboxylase carboxyltransferase subunit alpha [Nonomuraea sp. NPDC005983]|uniref:acetyl-CoA carboxylase carboxyltransferase subunit alpha n=1 Tax=Nonomuraea sp. NPDC005983 TaxID=3155595 RepID=UPI0033AC7B92